MLSAAVSGALKKAPSAPADPLKTRGRSRRRLFYRVLRRHGARHVLGPRRTARRHVLQSNFASLFPQRHRFVLFMESGGH